MLWSVSVYPAMAVMRISRTWGKREEGCEAGIIRRFAALHAPGAAQGHGFIFSRFCVSVRRSVRRSSLLLRGARARLMAGAATGAELQINLRSVTIRQLPDVL